MNEYTSLIIGGVSGLSVAIATVIYMRWKQKRYIRMHPEISFPKQSNLDLRLMK